MQTSVFLRPQSRNFEMRWDPGTDLNHKTGLLKNCKPEIQKYEGKEKTTRGMENEYEPKSEI